MKAVIFAGGFGTRISEESGVRPKPMVEIGGRPILWHIMKTYYHYGVDEFVILCGYKSVVIKEYFANHWYHGADVTFDHKNKTTTVHVDRLDPWKVTLVETGLETMTGGRLLQAKPYVDDKPFYLTYGDGVSDIDIGALTKQHEATGATVTMTAVQPPGRFGILQLGEGNHLVEGFREKPVGDGGGWINGGYFICNPEVFGYLKDDTTIFEQDPLINLSKEGKLSAYRHEGFWHPMDTLRDKNVLEGLWQQNKAPWHVWK